MLRRALLLLLLAAPLGAMAQVTFSPTALGKNDCGSSTDNLAISWTSAVTDGTSLQTTDIYKIMVSQSSTCLTTDTTTQQLGSNLAASTLTGAYTLTRSDFLNAAGVTCGTTKTVYVCVTLYATNGTTVRGSAVTGSIKYDLTPPPVPVSLAVSPGDSALYVSWAAGSSSTSSVAADHYEVTMTVVSGAGDSTAVHGPQSFTGTSGRFTGLVNGVTYSATVVAVSAGGNASAPSAAATGTPKPVSDYWAQYKANGGVDPGGCAGGPAGLLSLLGLAVLARTFRRRS